MVGQDRGAVVAGSGSSGVCDAGTRPHGLGDDLEFVGAGFVVLLLVLNAVVVFEEKLAGLLEHPAALADGTVGHKTRD